MNIAKGRFCLVVVLMGGVLSSAYPALARSGARRGAGNRSGRSNNQRSQQQAQQRQQQEEMKIDEARWQERSLAQIESLVDLTPEQKAKVEPMLEKMSGQIAQISSRTNLSAEQKQKEIQDLYKTTWKQVLAILTPQQRAKLQQNQLLEMLTQALTLTDSQHTRVQLALQDELAQTDALSADQTGGTGQTVSAQKLTDKKQTIDDDIWTRIEAVLTPEQLKKLDALRAKQMVDGLNKQLTLDEDQKTQITSIVTANTPQLRTVRADATLSPIDRAAQLHQLRQDLRGQIRPLLSTRQQTLFDAPPSPTTGKSGE